MQSLRLQSLMRIILPVSFTFAFTLAALFGGVVPETRAATEVALGAYGTQIGNMTVPSSAQYVGGGFRMVTSASTTVTKFVVREQGNVSDADLSNVRLFYDLDTTAPYDCASETYSASDATMGFASTFSSSQASFTGSVAIGATQSACFYVVVDVQNSAENGETLEIQVSPANIIVSGDFEVVSENGPTDTSPEAIPGTTVMTLPPPSVVTVSSTGTQQSTVVSPAEGVHIGGAFSMLPDSGSTVIKQITLYEGGTVSANLDLSQARLFYEFDTSSPYDCASESYGGDEDEFGSSTSFSAVSKADFSGNVTITNTQAACFYPVMDIENSADDGDTIEIRIQDPDDNVTVEVGGSVGTTNDVDISGTTIIEATPEFGVVVSAFGTQASLLNATAGGQYVGGGFRLSAQTGTPSITKIGYSTSGTISAVDIDTVQLHYDLDTASPYDCASESFSSSDPLYGTPIDPAFSTTAFFVDEVTISPTSALCIYPVINMDEADEGDTFEARLLNPSQNVVASGGAEVSPSSNVEIEGTSVISATADSDPETVVVNDGDLIRAEGDHRVYIVKFVGAKKFIRHIVSPDIFTFYGHFNFAAVKDVPSLDGYTLSAWVRAVGTAPVYEINADGTAHHITCDDDTGQGDGSCANEWFAAGGDPDGIYDINPTEMGWYQVTNPVVLPDIAD